MSSAPSSSRSRVGLFDLGEHFAFLFLDVMRDIFAKNLDLGVIHLIVGVGVLELLDQALDRGVFHFGLVKHVLAFFGESIAGGRIEDLFLDFGMDRKRVAYLFDDACFIAAVFLCLLELLEELFDLL